MSAIEKLRSQVAIARELGHLVVLTPDEAQAVVDESDPYQALEREHLGNAGAGTGIYHPDNQRRADPPGDDDVT